MFTNALPAATAAMLALTISSVSAQPSVDGTAPTSTPTVSHAAVLGGDPVTLKAPSGSVSAIIETPTATGQHSAIVIIAAGGQENEAAAQTIAKQFAARGIVALSYYTPDANAGAAESAVETLRQRGDVKRGQIGLIGIGAGSSILSNVASSTNALYAIAVRTTKDGKDLKADAKAFGKGPDKVLLVQAMTDPFSQQTEKLTTGVQKSAKNVTIWTTSDDDVQTFGADNSSLLARVIDWAAAREI